MSSIGLLAAGVAHEVNTPLAVISSYTQMLAKEMQQDEKKSVLLDRITRQAFRASEIVNNLLNFSRTSGTEFTEVDLNKIIQDTLALLDHQFKAGAEFRWRTIWPPDLPRIHGNNGKLQQVFLNLFLNARDAMPGGGTLRVDHRRRHNVSVLVTDTRQRHCAGAHCHASTIRSSPPRTLRRKANHAARVWGFPSLMASFRSMRARSAWRAAWVKGRHFHLGIPAARKAVNA